MRKMRSSLRNMEPTVFRVGVSELLKKTHSFNVTTDMYDLITKALSNDRGCEVSFYPDLQTDSIKDWIRSTRSDASDAPKTPKIVREEAKAETELENLDLSDDEINGRGFFTKSKPNKKTNWLSRALTPKKRAATTSGSGLLSKALKLQKQRIAKANAESVEGSGFFPKAMRQKKKVATNGEGGVLVGSTRRVVKSVRRSKGGVLVGSSSNRRRSRGGASKN